MIALLLITASAFGQVAGSSVYVGIAMPRKASSAGPVLGYKYQYDLPVAGLGVIGSVDFTLYGADKDLRNATDKAFNFWKETFNYDDADAKTRHREPVNFAVPINFGANYHYSFGRIAPWAEAGIGFAPVFTSKQVYLKSTPYSSAKKLCIYGEKLCDTGCPIKHATFVCPLISIFVLLFIKHTFIIKILKEVFLCRIMIYLRFLKMLLLK